MKLEQFKSLVKNWSTEQIVAFILGPYVAIMQNNGTEDDDEEIFDWVFDNLPDVVDILESDDYDNMSAIEAMYAELWLQGQVTVN